MHSAGGQLLQQVPVIHLPPHSFYGVQGPVWKDLAMDLLVDISTAEAPFKVSYQIQLFLVPAFLGTGV